MSKPPARLLALLSMVAAAMPAMAARVKAPPRVEIVGFWRFEKELKSEGRSPAVGPAKRLDAAECFFSNDVPGGFIYDPLQKVSYSNSSSLNFQSKEGRSDALEIALDAVKAGLPGKSFTLELFFKPDGEWNAPLVMKSRSSAAASEWGLEASFFEAQQQTYLHGFFTPPGGQTQHFRGGHLGTSAQVHRENPAWRHLAFVCDSAAGTLSCYIDYYQAKTIPLPGAVKWDAGPFYIGGGPAKADFVGKIDEVRLTQAALRPPQFLRARPDSLAGVSFESVETVLPRDSGYIDLKEAFGAAGDGKTDDTAAFNEAFRVLPNRVPFAHHTLYVAPGTYLVSDTLQSSRFFTVQGAGADKTVIKLRDKCVGFGNPAEPRPVWRASSTKGPPGSNEAVNASSTAISIYDLAIDTGKGNPGAKGLEYHANNAGRLDGVQIRSGDGEGVVGLDLTHKANGPALIKNVRVQGFDFGVASAWQEYSMTFEHLTLEGQRTAGIKNAGNILAIRDLRSTNRVPAISSEGMNSMITLLDSSLKGGTPNAAALHCDGGLYALRVETGGYQSAISKRLLVNAKTKESKEETVAGPKIEEYVGDPIVVGHGQAAGAWKLPIEETPEVPWGDIHKDWVNVKAFENRKAENDWAPAIQAAIDSGAKTVYFPQARYEVASPIHLRGNVERLFGLHSRIMRAKDSPPDQPALIFDEPNGQRTVCIERLDIDFLRDKSPATLVLKSSSTTRYTNAEGCGKLFLEDLSGEDFRFDHPQTVWARQWNPQGHNDGPCITSHGATMWCLGLKTESDGSLLWADAGAQTEILGALIYPVGKIPDDRPIFKNTDAKMSVIYGTSVSQTNHKLHILDVQAGDVKSITGDQLQPAGSRARMDLFSSDATAQ